MVHDIQERTFRFGVRVVKMAVGLPKTRIADTLGRQLVRSGTSIGANVEEASAAYSREDFVYRLNIALKEARETHYWLRMIRSCELSGSDGLDAIIEESEQVKKILGAIVSNSRKNSRKHA